MAQTEMDRLFAFIAFWTASRAEAKEPALYKVKGQNKLRSALLYSLPGGAQVARQRCPILHPGDGSISPDQPFAKGTSLLCRLGDISTLH